MVVGCRGLREGEAACGQAGERAFGRGGRWCLEYMFRVRKWRCFAGEAHAGYACRSMRSEHGAGPFVTRNQEGRSAVVLPAGSVWRSIAQPRALAPDILDTAKQRTQDRQ